MNKEQRLTEPPESEATGHIRRIYDEIKYFSGVPMVALIYRHMATLPGVLEWAWQLQRPLMVSGLLQEKAWQLASAVNLPEVPPIPFVARQATGVSLNNPSGSRTQILGTLTEAGVQVF
jgi:hypothetical protein